MKAWDFKVKSNSQEIANKLNTAFIPGSGFVLNMGHDKNDTITFKIRKRILYAFQFLLYNKIIVKGKMLKANTENETTVEIHFIQDFLTTLYISIIWGFGLLAIILGIISSATLYIPGGILLTVGLALWIDIRKRFKRNIQKYKSLISEVLEL